MADFASRDDDFAKIDHSVKNVFRWEWLQKDVDGTVLSECIRKLKVPGKYMCIWCGDTNNHGARGLAALRDHMKSSKHIAKKRFARRKLQHRVR